MDQKISLLLLPLGTAIVLLDVFLAPPEKTAIVVSVMGLFALLAGLYRVGGNIDAKLPTSSRFLFTVLVLCAIISVLPPRLTPSLVRPIAVSIALLTLLPLSRSKNISGIHIALLAVFLGALGSYEVLYYYPLNLGVDAWSYLSVSSSIVQTGHYSVTSSQAIVSYYAPFPIMSIAPAMFATITGLDLTTSLFLFPGLLIVLQPLFVFLIARSAFGIHAASLSALTVVSEAAVIGWINAPIAKSVALSLLMLVLLLLLKGPMSASRFVSALILFLVLAPLHGGVALISIFLFWVLVIPKNRSTKGIVRVLTLLFLGYLVATATISSILYPISSASSSIFGFISGASSSTPAQVAFAGSSSGLPFIWWGWPVALTLILFFLDRRRSANWIYLGLGLLGLSFVANVVAPGADIDRYGGLAAWLILAVTGGRALSIVTKTRRQILLAIPILMLVFSSSMINPTISPQYGIVHGYVLPTSIADREALNWVSGYVHTRGYITVTDIYSRAYLRFVQLDSGFDYQHYVGVWDTQSPYLPRGSNVFFARSADFRANPSGACRTSLLLPSKQNTKINIVFSNACDVLVVSP
ncbi:MAG: hypothetical protein ABSF63_06360 [Candidatus Bathyarchaeia archaeon]